MDEKETTEIYDSWDVKVPPLIRNTLLKNKVYLPENLETTVIKITPGSKKHRLLLELRESLGFSDVASEQFKRAVPESLQGVRWEEVELKVNSRIEDVLKRYRLDFIEDIADFLDQESVVCPESGRNLVESEIPNFGASSLSKLKKEIEKLCSLGFDGYRKDGLQNVNTAADLVSAICEKLSERDAEIFRSPESKVSLAKRFGLSAVRISKIKEKVASELTEAERETARSLLDKCWGPRGERIAVPINEAASVLGAKSQNEVRLLCKIANPNFFVDEKAGALFGISETQIKQTREALLAEISSGKVSFENQGVFYFQTEDGSRYEINRDDFFPLIGNKKIAGQYRSQIVANKNASNRRSNNGVGFGELRPSGLFNDAESLAEFLRENSNVNFRVSPSGAIRVIDKATNRSDDVVQTLKEAEGALTRLELENRTKKKWLPGEVATVFTDRLEIIAKEPSRYVHFEKLGLSYDDVKTLSRWAEQTLRNRTEPTSFEELFEEYKTVNGLPHVENADQIASCAQKHECVKRESKGPTRKVKHIAPYLDIQFPNETHPEITNQLHAEENLGVEFAKHETEIDSPSDAPSLIPLSDLNAVRKSPSNEPVEFAVVTEEDFIRREENQRRRGRLAEDIAVKAEVERLRKAGHHDPHGAVKPVWYEPARGYDVLSIEMDGSPRHIEVKSTGRSANGTLSFMLSSNEFDKSRSLPNYWFYLVIEVDSDSPEILTVPGTKVLEKFLTAKSFEARFCSASGGTGVSSQIS